MTSFDRRNFCKSSIAFAGFGVATNFFMPSLSQARTLDLGSAKLESFSDGVMRLPIEMLFENVPTDERDQLLSDIGSAVDVISRPVNVNLLSTGSRKILFDAGSGKNFLSSLGQLSAVLEEASVDLAGITDVVFTHAHPDHIWGIIDEFDDLLMPDASYHISEAEWAFWDSEDALSSMPAGWENFAVGAKSRFDLLRDRINLFSAGAEIIPSVEAIDTSGHTPGHMAFAIHDKGQSVLIAGDSLTHPVISFKHPEWQNSSDMDTENAVKTRIRLLDRLTQDKFVLAATHLPAPGYGRVEKDGTAWRFIET